MGRGIRVGTVVGAPVVVSTWWFLIAGLLTVWIAPVYASWVPGLSQGSEFALAALFVVLLYLSAFLHELGHAFSARAFGLRVHRVELTALGGLTQMDSPPTPWRSAITSAAGPAVNVVLVLVALGALNATADGTLPHLFAAQLAWTNALVAVFNLLPGLPLDGGAILRALIWRATGRPGTATIAAAWIGRAIAVAAALWFLARAAAGASSLGTIWALVLAVWMWAASGSAIAAERARAVLPTLSARALARPAVLARADEPLSQLMARMGEAGARGALVVDSAGVPTGVVSEAAVAAAPRVRWPWIAASTVARRLEPGHSIDAELTGETLMRALAATPANEYVVREADGSVLGVLAFSDVEAAMARR